MPLALGYLKAYAQKDEAIKKTVDFRIFNYRGADQPIRMVPEVLIAEPPDILACSVFGWNFRNFGQLATTFRQIKPAGWTIFGGTHVAMQAKRVFACIPTSTSWSMAKERSRSPTCFAPSFREVAARPRRYSRHLFPFRP